LYNFARRHGHLPPDAQDLTQGFFLHLLEHWALSQVDRLRGKFRSFLLAYFQNYLFRLRRSVPTHASEAVSVRLFRDLENAENRYRLEPADHLTKSATADQLQIQERSFGQSKTDETTPLGRCF
jgi:RNA polymerase sigma-70 factor (ECF subfamily)